MLGWRSPPIVSKLISQLTECRLAILQASEVSELRYIGIDDLLDSCKRRDPLFVPMEFDETVRLQGFRGAACHAAPAYVGMHAAENRDVTAVGASMHKIKCDVQYAKLFDDMKQRAQAPAAVDLTDVHTVTLKKPVRTHRMSPLCRYL